MKITIEPTDIGRFTDEPLHNHDTVSVSYPNDDIDMHKMMQMVRSALIASGYSEEQVNEYIPPQ